MITKHNIKFYLFLAWPILAGVLVAIIAICCAIAIASILITWPLIPFMRVKESKLSGWSFDYPWSRA